MTDQNQVQASLEAERLLAMRALEAFKNADLEKAITHYETLARESTNRQSFYSDMLGMCKQGIKPINHQVAANKSSLIKDFGSSELNYRNNSNKNCDEISLSSEPHDFYGKIEKFESGILSGWALNSIEGSTYSSFVILIDGVPSLIGNTKQLRADVCEVFNKEGHWGFSCQLPKQPNGKDDIEVSICSPYQIATVRKSNGLKISNKPIGVPHYKFEDASTLANRISFNHKTFQNSTVRRAANRPNVTFIMLTLNGLTCLRWSVPSLLKEMINGDHLLIIDHGSRDGTASFISDINSGQISFIPRDSNYSFSNSSNFGANLAAHDYLIFVNNDIVLTKKSVDALISPLIDNDAHISGGILFDIPLDARSLEDLDAIPLCIQHAGIGFHNRDEYLINPFDLRKPIEYIANSQDEYAYVEGVTGALFAIRKDCFTKLGGFSDDYFYGMEDVDICLRATLDHNMSICISKAAQAFHFHGYTRLNNKQEASISPKVLANNKEVLNQKFGRRYRHQLILDKLRGLSSSNNTQSHDFKVLFLVSDPNINTSKADLFTAIELGKELEKNEWIQCFYSSTESAIDVSEFDAIINMAHSNNIGNLCNLKSTTIVCAWMRNWFDKWCDDDYSDIYDIIFCSSRKACRYVDSILKVSSVYLPLAASAYAISYDRPKKQKSKSYCFIGSYFNSPRRLAEWLQPETLDYEFHLYGYGWESHERFKDYTKGSVAYEKVFDIYRNSHLVVDDANIATDPWGSVNSRVFDALAMGIPVITNGSLGSLDAFDGKLPTYNNADELHCLIAKVFQGEYDSAFEYLTKHTAKFHTYRDRAETVLHHFRNILSFPVVRIATGIPKPNVAKWWGDLYLAREIKSQLNDNYRVQISFGESLSRRCSGYEDLIVNLRGLEPFHKKFNQKTFNWIISHPEKVSMDEVINCDYLAAASSLFVESVSKIRETFGSSPVEFIPQFATIHHYSDHSESQPKFDFVFIGNSRGIFRESVNYSIKAGLNLGIIGNGWDGLVADDFIISTFAPNFSLSSSYRLGEVVLCDHWDDMKRYGFISNRIFDLMAIGSKILTDYVPGIEAISNQYSGLSFYVDYGDFVKKARATLDAPQPKPLVNFHNDGLSLIAHSIKEILK